MAEMLEVVCAIADLDEPNAFLAGDVKFVVRCKDCEFFNDYHNKCYRTATIIDIDGNVYLTDEEDGYLSMTDATADGFCAWGERRQDNDR